MAKSKTPYKLPVPIVIDRADLDEYGLPTFDKLIELIQQHQTGIRRYDYLENLYLGYHDIFLQPDKKKWKPDWRLAVGFPRYLTDTFVGYGYSIPVKISHKDSAVQDDINRFFDNFDFSEFLETMITWTAVYGHAWSYVYQDEEGKTCLTCLSPKEMFCVYDDTMKRRALFSVRYGIHTVGRYKGELYGEITSPQAVRHFDHGEWSGPAEVNEYGRINCVEWMLNRDRLGLFEPVASLVEIYDHTISEKGNDVDSFAEAVLAVIGAEVDEDDLADARDKRIINLFGSDDAKNALVQYLSKPVADGTQENLLDRLERLIFQTAMVANISDEDFGSATSGSALGYKLWSTSNIVSKFNAKAEKSLRKILKLWGAFATNTNRPDAYKEVSVTFTTNLPKNLSEETSVARQAEGLISHRKQLSLLSYVDDPDAELEQIKKERKEAVKEMASYGDGDV